MKKKNLIILAVYLLLSMITLRKLLFKPGYPAFHDLAPIFSPEQLWRPFYYPWDNLSNLGTPNLLLNNALYNIPIIFLTYMGIPIDFAHKILLYLYLVLSVYGFYLLFSTILSSEIAGFISGILCGFNPWIWMRWNLGHNTLILSYLILPFSLLYFYKYIELGEIKYILLTSLLGALLAIAQPHIFYMFIMFQLLFMLFQGLRAKRYVTRVALILLSTGLILVPYAFPILFFTPPVYAIRPEEANLGSGTIFHFLPLIIVIVSALTLYIVRGKLRVLTEIFIKSVRKWEALFYLILGLLGIFLTLTSLDILKPAYLFLFNYIPGMWMFRDTTKFLLFPIITSAYYLGVFTKLLSKVNNKFKKLIMMIVIILILMVSLYPIFLYNNINSVELPASYEKLYKWLKNEVPEYYRIAFIPPAVWATKYDWQKAWFLDPFIALQPRPTVEIKSEMDLTEGASIVRWIYASMYSKPSNVWLKALGMLGVKYIILRRDADLPTYRDDLKNFTRAKSKNVEGIFKDLKVFTIGKNILIYENKYALPILYSPKGFSLVIGDRTTLLKLLKVNFDIYSYPPVFIDDIKLKELRDLRPDYVIIDGDQYWSLIELFLGEEHVIKPWKYAPLSSNPSIGWVRGDLTWYLYGGALHSIAENYIFTLTKSNITIPFTVEKSGLYHLVVQAFKNLPKGENAFIKIENMEYFLQLIDNKTSGYKWIYIGPVYLKSGKHKITITSMGAVALSKILIVPEPDIINIEKEVLRWFNEEKLEVIMLTDIEWKGKVGNCEFSVFTSKPLRIILFYRSKSDGNVKLKIGDELYNIQIKAGEGVRELEAVRLKPSNYKMEIIRDHEDMRLEVILSTIRLKTQREALEPLLYTRPVPFKIKTRATSNYIAFLEADAEYWKAVIDNREAHKLRIFGYGQLYKVPPGKDIIIRYEVADSILKILEIYPIILLGIPFSHNIINRKKR